MACIVNWEGNIKNVLKDLISRGYTEVEAKTAVTTWYNEIGKASPRSLRGITSQEVHEYITFLRSSMNNARKKGTSRLIKRLFSKNSIITDTLSMEEFKDNISVISPDLFKDVKCLGLSPKTTVMCVDKSELVRGDRQLFTEYNKEDDVLYVSNEIPAGPLTTSILLFNSMAEATWKSAYNFPTFKKNIKSLKNSFITDATISILEKDPEIQNNAELKQDLETLKKKKNYFLKKFQEKYPEYDFTQKIEEQFLAEDALFVPTDIDFIKSIDKRIIDDYNLKFQFKILNIEKPEIFETQITHDLAIFYGLNPIEILEEGRKLENAIADAAAKSKQKSKESKKEKEQKQSNDTTENSDDATEGAKNTTEETDNINNVPQDYDPTKPTNSLSEALARIAVLRNFSKSNIKFIPEDHSYIIFPNTKKEKAISVSEYYNIAFNEENKINGDYSHSSALGNEFDLLARTFFENSDAYAELVKNHKFEILNEKIINYITGKLEEFSKNIEKKFGTRGTDYEIITSEIPMAVRSDDRDKSFYLAGTMDMVIIDREGKAHIVDFKVKKGEKNQKGPDANNSKNIISMRNYTAQQNLYAKMLTTLTGIPVEDMNLYWVNATYENSKLNNTNSTIRYDEKAGIYEVKDGDNWVPFFDKKSNELNIQNITDNFPFVPIAKEKFIPINYNFIERNSDNDESVVGLDIEGEANVMENIIKPETAEVTKNAENDKKIEDEPVDLTLSTVNEEDIHFSNVKSLESLSVNPLDYKFSEVAKRINSGKYITNFEEEIPVNEKPFKGLGTETSKNFRGLGLNVVKHTILDRSAFPNNNNRDIINKIVDTTLKLTGIELTNIPEYANIYGVLNVIADNIDTEKFINILNTLNIKGITNEEGDIIHLFTPDITEKISLKQLLAIQREKEEVKQKAFEDGTFMKAPNGKDSNLNEDQWLLVRTKAFKEWFGDWEKFANIPEELLEQITLVFERNPELSRIGTVKEYAAYLKEVFPNSIDKAIYWHGSDSDFSQGFNSAIKGKGSGSPHISGEFYLAKQAWSVLQYVSGVNRSFGPDVNGFNHWNKLWWELKEIMSNGRRENNDWKDLIIGSENVRQAIPNKKGIFNRDSGGENGKWLRERKADYGYQNKTDVEFFKDIFGIEYGKDTFNTWTQRNAEIFKSLVKTEKGIYPAIINTINPIRESGKNTYYEPERGLFTRAKEKNNDAILGANTDNEFNSDVAVIFNAQENIHFLGTTQDIALFRQWLKKNKASKVIDIKTDEPLVVYHGTNNKFSKFNTELIGRLDPGYFGRGFYFTPDKSMAEGYAKGASGNIIMGVFLNIRQPLNTDMNNTSLMGSALEGYDGAIIALGEDILGLNDIKYDPNEIMEIVAKNPNQIKSATENIGTYSKDEDIRYASIKKEELGDLGGDIKAISTASNPIQIYSDGSDFKGTGKIGYGAVFEYNNKQYGLSGTDTGEEIQNLKAKFPDAEFSNPTMEMLALATVLEHFAKLNIGEHIEINQDYKGAVNYAGLWEHSEGSAQRGLKAWKAQKPYIKYLVDRAVAAIDKIKQDGGSVKIKWVKGHQNVGTEEARMNDAADRYAKSRDNSNTINDAYQKQQSNPNYLRKNISYSYNNGSVNVKLTEGSFDVTIKDSNSTLIITNNTTNLSEDTLIGLLKSTTGSRIKDLIAASKIENIGIESVDDVNNKFKESLLNKANTLHYQDIRNWLKGQLTNYAINAQPLIGFPPALLNYIKSIKNGNFSEASIRISELSDEDIEKYSLSEFLSNQQQQAQRSNFSGPETKINNAIQTHRGNWSRQEAENNPDILYVFTDNTDRDSGSGKIPDDSWYSKKYGKGKHYPGATAAVVRGLDNSRPLSTMRYFYKTHNYKYPTDRSSKALWHDSDVEEFKKVIREELEEIVKEFNTGKYKTIMFPNGDGLFNTKLSNITKERTPKLYQALADLLHEYGFDSMIPTAVTSTQKKNINKTESLDYIKEQQSLSSKLKVNDAPKEDTSGLKEYLDSIEKDRKIFTPEERESIINTLYIQMQNEALKENGNNEVKAKEAITKDFDEYFNKALLEFKKITQRPNIDKKYWFTTSHLIPNFDITPSGNITSSEEKINIIQKLTGSKEEDIYKAYHANCLYELELILRHQNEIKLMLMKELSSLLNVRLKIDNSQSLSEDEIIDNDSNIDEDVEDFDDKATGKDGYHIKFNQVSGLSSMSTALKQTLSSLYDKDVNGNNKLTYSGRYKCVSADKAYAIVLEALENITLPQDMMNAIGKAAEKYKFLEDLIYLLNKNPELKAQLWHVCRASARNYEILFLDDKYKKFGEPHSLKVKKSNQKEAQESIFTEWEMNIIHNSNNLDECGFKIKGGIIQRDENISIPEEKSKIEECIKFLGIPEHILPSYVLNENDPSAKTNFKKKLDEIISYIKRNPINTLQDFFNQSGVKRFASYLISTDSVVESMAYENNKSYYARTKPSFITDLITNFRRFREIKKKAKEEEEKERINFLSQTPQGNYYGSPWYYDFVNKQFIPLWLQENSRGMGDHVQVLSAYDKEYEDLTPAEHVLACFEKFNNSFTASNINKRSAYYVLPMLSDAPSFEFVQGPAFDNAFDNKTYWENMVSVVRQEYNRIQLVKTRAKAFDDELLSPALKIANFDGKRGLEYCFFPNLNSDINFIFKCDYKDEAEEGLEIEVNLNDLLEKIPQKIKSNPNRLEKISQEIKEHWEKQNGVIDETKIQDKIIEGALRSMMDTLYNEEVEYWKSIGVLEGKNTKFNSGRIIDEETGNLIDEKKPTDLVKNYFYNNVLATANIIQLTTGDLAYYKDFRDFQKRYKEVHAPAQHIYTEAEYKGFKLKNHEIARSLIIKDDERTSESIMDVMPKYLDKLKNEGSITKLEREALFNIFEKAYSNVNVADAQAYRCPESYRAMMIGMGKWNDELETVYNKMIDPNSNLNFNDFNVFWQTFKPYVFAMIPTDTYVSLDENNNYEVDYQGGVKINVPTQFKNSEYVLLASMISRFAGSLSNSGKLRGIQKFMKTGPNGAITEKGDYFLDTVQFESTTKVGSHNVVDLTRAAIDKYKKEHGEKYKEDHDGKEMDDEVAVLNMLNDAYNTPIVSKEVYETKYGEGSYDNIKGSLIGKCIIEYPQTAWGIQTETPEHLIDHVTIYGSQYRNLIMSNLDPNAKYDIEINGKKISVDANQLYDYYNECIVQNVLNDLSKVYNRLINESELSKMLQEEALNSASFSQSFLDAVTLKNGEFKIPLWSSYLSNRVQSAIMSIINKAVVKQTSKGGSAVQVSCYGVSELDIIFKTKNGKELNYKSWKAEEGNKNKSHKDYVKYITELLKKNDVKVDAFECYMPIYSKQLLEAYMDKETGEVNIKKIQDENPDLLEAIGFRIPTEDKYSMAPLRIKGFLPQSTGSAIMLPAEITAIAGSDFDVDKLYILLPSFKNKGTKIKYENPFQTILQGKTINFDKIKDLTNDQRNNLLIKIGRAVLTNSSTTLQLLRPGGFARQSKASRIGIILSTLYNELEAKIKEEKGETPSNLEVFNYLLKTDNKILDEFIDQYESIKQPLVPSLQTRLHSQNFIGKKMIGIYANGSSNISKTQHLPDAKINDKKAFFFMGTKRTKLDAIKVKDTISGDNLDKFTETTLGTYISDLMANYSACSVDNVKDNTLYGTNQNEVTANITILLCNLGYSPEQIVLLMTQPIVMDMVNTIRTSGRFDAQNIIKEILASWKAKASNEGKKIKEPNMDSNNGYTFPLDFFLESFKDAAHANEDNDNFEKHIQNQYSIGRLFQKLYDLGDLKSKIIKATRADSVNSHKVSLSNNHSMYEALRELRESSELNGEVFENCTPYNNVEPILSGEDNFDTLKKKLYESAEAAPISYMDIFKNATFTLEQAIFKKYNFLQFDDKIKPIWDDLRSNLTSKNIPDTLHKKFYDDLVHVILSKHPLFSKDEREYYLTEFPKEFNLKLNKISKIDKAVSRYSIFKQLNLFENRATSTYSLTLRKMGKLKQTATAVFTNDWLNLLQHDVSDIRDLGMDLIKYAYYTSGFNFKGGTFGHLIPVEIIEYLYDNKEVKDAISDTNFLNNFLEQFIRNHKRDLYGLPKIEFEKNYFYINDNIVNYITSFNFNRPIEIPLNPESHTEENSEASSMIEDLKNSNKTKSKYFIIPVKNGEKTYNILATLEKREERIFLKLLPELGNKSNTVEYNLTESEPSSVFKKAPDINEEKIRSNEDIDNSSRYSTVLDNVLGAEVIEEKNKFDIDSYSNNNDNFEDENNQLIC